MQKDLKASTNSIEDFENIIDYKFKEKKYIEMAFTHSSYANECKTKDVKSNERLEFLGDAVLNLAISEFIYRHYPDMAEGDMTKYRANIVCEASLEKCANEIQIGRFLKLGKGEELTGGRSRTSILSDSFEAVIGAIFIDGGLESARKFILKHMRQLIYDSLNGTLFMDYKTELQETIQKSNGDRKIVYEIVEELGPDHNKVFVLRVKVDNDVLGIGRGKTKKEAEQYAAKVALENLEKNN